MPAKIHLDAAQQQALRDAFYSSVAMSSLPYSFKVVDRYWGQWFTKEERAARHARLSSERKLGDKNPMFGKTGLQHHNAVERNITTQGYIEVWAPAWYEGRTDGGKVLEHILVWCEAHGYTAVPEGWVVHHLDHSRDNNAVDNLLLMTVGEHLAYHNTNDPVRATTILQRSRQQELPKRSPSP
mgnify:CR=1 FL=1